MGCVARRVEARQRDATAGRVVLLREVEPETPRGEEDAALGDRVGVVDAGVCHLQVVRQLAHLAGDAALHAQLQLGETQPLQVGVGGLQQPRHEGRAAARQRRPAVAGSEREREWLP